MKNGPVIVLLKGTELIYLEKNNGVFTLDLG